MSPLVSVVIPTHNRPKMLAEAVASVRAQQAFSDYEIVIASNGEANPLLSQQVATKFGCRFIEFAEANRSLARNMAIEQAQGEWIAFLDDDDLWLPTKLAAQVDFAAASNADCVFTNVILRSANGSECTHRVGPYKHYSIPESFMIWRSGGGGCSAALVKRKALLAIGGFDVNMTLTEDWDMWRRLAQTCKVAYLGKPLSVIRTHGVNGEDIAILQPWRCTYWDLYHAFKTIRDCPPELRHMIPAVTRFMIERTFFWYPIYLMAGRKPFRGPIARLRAWVRIKRRINVFAGREVFPVANRVPVALERDGARP